MVDTVRAPYVGLRPFSAADSAFFFGRENERRIVNANVTASRLTILYGPSGVGKSSVLGGGVVYDFAQIAKERQGAPRFAAAYFRDWSKWRDDPMSGVATSIHECLAADYGLELRGDPADFQATIRAWMETQQGGLLIVLDQFEEYLLYHHGDGLADSFASQFPEVVGNSDLRVNILIALRDDALARLDKFKGEIPNLFDNRLQLKLLSHQAAREAITRPLEELRASGVADVVIEDALVDAVLNQVAAGRVKLGTGGDGELAEGPTSAKADRPVEAPYLQLVMERVWDQEMEAGSRVLRLETFQQLGQAQRIVQNHLDTRMSALSDNDQNVAGDVFRFLVTPSGAKIALSAYDLAHSAGIDEADVKPVLEALTVGNARILRSIAEPSGEIADESRYEIFHDALARAILDWTERRKKAADEKRLSQARADYQREKTRRIRIGGVAGLLSLLVIALIFVLADGRNAANRDSRARSLAAQATKSLTDDPQRGLLLALYAASTSYGKNGVLLPEVEEALHRALEATRTRAIIPVKGGRVFDIAVSPDGSTLATGDSSGVIKLWDAASGSELRTIRGHRGSVNRLAFSPDGKELASASNDSTARIWNLAVDQRSDTGLVLRGHLGTVDAIAYSRNGRLLLTGGEDGALRLWDAVTGQPVWIHLQDAAVTAVGFFSGYGPLLLLSADSKGAYAWNVDGTIHCRFAQAFDQVNALAVVPRSMSVATASQDGTAMLWDVEKCVEQHRFPAHTNSLFDVAASPDGTMLATASSDGTVKVWSVSTYDELFALVGHGNAVRGVKFAPAGSSIYTASWDSTARVWDGSRVMSEVDVLQTEDPRATIRTVAFDHSGSALVAVDQFQNRVLVSNLIHPRRGYKRGFGGTVFSAAFSPDGSRLAVGGAGGLKLFDAREASLMANLDSSQLGQSGTFFITALTFNPNGSRIAFGSDSGRVGVWTPEDSSLITLGYHHGRVNSVVYDSSGDRLLTASDDGTALIWTFNEGKVVIDTVERSGVRIASAAFAPNGGMVATAGEDKLIRIRSLRNRDSVVNLHGPNNTIWSVAFDGSGRRIASASFDGTARIWNTTDGYEVMRLRSDRGRMYGIAFSPDGRYVASSDNQGTVHVSIVDPLTLLLRGWDYVNRPFTKEECEKWLGVTADKCPQTARVVSEGRALAKSGDIAKAAAKFREGKRLDPVFRQVNADSLAAALAADAWINRGLAFLRGNKTAEGMDQFEKARRADTVRTRDVVPDVVSGIADILGSGDTSVVAGGLSAYRQAMTWDPEFKPSAEVSNNVCWWASISGYAKDVVEVCEQAVRASPDDGNIKDSRGVNRALRGDLRGAREDFAVFVANAQDGPAKKRRLRWIAALTARINPFTTTELAQLRRE